MNYRRSHCRNKGIIGFPDGCRQRRVTLGPKVHNYTWGHDPDVLACQLSYIWFLSHDVDEKQLDKLQWEEKGSENTC